MRTDQTGRARLAGLILLALAGGLAACEPVNEAGSTPSAGGREMDEDGHGGLLHGRVITSDGTVYEGRLRFGADEEATWLHQFNGVRRGNRWASFLPAGEATGRRFSARFLGLEFSVGRPQATERPFVVRMGDITRIDAFSGLTDRPEKLNTKAQNILVVGVDDRETATKAERRRWKLGNDEYGKRTDVMMLFHVSPESRSISAVTISPTLTGRRAERWTMPSISGASHSERPRAERAMTRA